MEPTRSIDSNDRRYDDFVDALRIMANSLLLAGRTDPVVREAIRRTAAFMLAEIQRGPTERTTEQGAESTEPFVPASRTRPTTAPLAGSAGSAIDASRSGEQDIDFPNSENAEWSDRLESAGARVDLPLVRRRLLMKVEGARWAAERRQLLDADADYSLEIEPNDREIIRRAKEIPGCFLWTNSPKSPVPSDYRAFKVLARCYENAASALGIVIALDDEGVLDADPRKHRAFQLLAEAQSALRVAATRAGGPEDADQYEVFQWLKKNTRDRAIYVARHMRVSDPADPEEWRSLAGRLEAFETELEAKRADDRERRTLFDVVRRSVAAIVEGVAANEAWRLLDESIEALVRSGLSPNDRELRESIAAIVDVVPDDASISPGFQRALYETRKFLAEKP